MMLVIIGHSLIFYFHRATKHKKTSFYIQIFLIAAQLIQIKGRFPLPVDNNLAMTWILYIQINVLCHGYVHDSDKNIVSFIFYKIKYDDAILHPPKLYFKIHRIIDCYVLSFRS